MWISVAVKALLVLEHHQGGVVQIRHLCEHPIAEFRMEPHLDPFLRSQRAGLVKNGIAHPDLADVVQKGSLLDHPELLRGQSQGFADSARVERNAP